MEDVLSRVLEILKHLFSEIQKCRFFKAEDDEEGDRKVHRPSFPIQTLTSLEFEDLLSF